MVIISLCLFIFLCAGHFLGDYVFQNDSIARGKNKNLQKELYGVHWGYWLTAHSVTHAFISTGIVLLFLPTLSYEITVVVCTLIFLIEAIFHWVIDYSKCDKFITLNQDQLLHIVVKGFIVVIVSVFLV